MLSSGVSLQSAITPPDTCMFWLTCEARPEGLPGWDFDYLCSLIIVPVSPFFRLFFSISVFNHIADLTQGPKYRKHGFKVSQTTSSLSRIGR